MFENLISALKAEKRTIVFTEGEDARILEAASRLKKDGLMDSILVGNVEAVKAAAAKGGFDIEGMEIIDPATYSEMDAMVEKMVELRKGKMSAEDCKAALAKGNYFGTMLVKMGKADALLGGATYSTADTVRPALQLIKTKPGAHLVSSCFILVREKDGVEEKLAMGNAHRCETLDELLEQSDAVTLHVDGRKSNTGFFGEDQFARMKQNAIFINLSRGFVANLDALKRHLDSGHLSGAAVDVFPVEPKKSGDPFDTDLADEDNMILTPHIGGSTLEAQKSIGHFVSQRLEDYWDKGSTMLSVNLPQVTLGPCKSAARIAHLHANLPGVLARVNHVLGKENINIAAQSLGTEGELGYVVTDVSQKPSQTTLDALSHIEGTIRMRVIS